MFTSLLTILALSCLLGMAAPSSQPKTAAGGGVRVSDGTGSPVTLNVPFTKGDYTLSPLNENLNEDVLMTARTLFIGLASGAPSFPQLSFSMHVGNVVGGTNTAPGTFHEFVTGKGAYGANISTLGASRKMTVDCRLSIEGTSWGDSADETIDCEDVRFADDFTESMDGNTLTANGKVLGSIIVTNNTNTITYSQAAF